MRRSASAAVLAALALLAFAPAALAQGEGRVGDPEGLGRFLAAFLVAVVTLVLSVALAMWSVKVAINMYDRWTKDIDEMSEIQKGNVAVGILMAAIIYSVASVISAGVGALTEAIKPFDLTSTYAFGVIIGVFNLLVALYLATLSVRMAMAFLNKFTGEVDELKEVARGNVAVAVLMAGVLISVSSVVQSGVAGIARILDAERVSRLLGF